MFGGYALGMLSSVLLGAAASPFAPMIRDQHVTNGWEDAVIIGAFGGAFTGFLFGGPVMIGLANKRRVVRAWMVLFGLCAVATVVGVWADVQAVRSGIGAGPAFFLFPLFTLFLGAIVYERVTPRIPPRQPDTTRCIYCDYDRSGLDHNTRCPECGGPVQAKEAHA